MSVARLITDTIRRVAEFCAGPAVVSVMRLSGGLTGGPLTIALIDLYTSIHRSLAHRVVGREEALGEVVRRDNNPNPNLHSLPVTARRKRGGAGAGPNSNPISTQSDINDVYAQHQVRPAFPPFPPYMAHAFFLLETGIVPVRPPMIKHIR